MRKSLKCLIKFGQKLLELIGYSLDEFQSFTQRGMLERELFGVKEKAVEFLDRLFYFLICDGVVAAFVVGPVADDRVIDRSEMDADLMCSSGLYFNIDEGELFEPLSNLPHRQRMSPVGRNGHLRTMPAVARDRAVDRSQVLAGAAMNKSDVRLKNLARSKLFR